MKSEEGKKTEPGETEEAKTLDLGVPGVEHILYGKNGLRYFSEQGMTVVLHGPPGSGKTLFALQAATKAAAGGKAEDGRPETGRLVFYLCKDTHPRVLKRRIEQEFDWYGLKEEDRPQLISMKKLKELKEPDPKKVGELVRIPNAEGCPGTVIFVDFGLNTMPAATIDRYSLDTSVFGGLMRLQPSYTSLFGAIAKLVEQTKNDQSAARTGKPQTKNNRVKVEVMVVLDSLPPSFVDECVRIRTEGDNDRHAESVGSGKSGENERTRLHEHPLVFLIMESIDLPNAIVSAFPPDVQLVFGTRLGPAGMVSKTICVAKSRFQRARGEHFPLVVKTKDVHSHPRFSDDASLGKPNHGWFWAEEWEFGMYLKPGVTVLPSIPSFSDKRADPEQQSKGKKSIKFCNANKGSLDVLVDGEDLGLTPGGCTLVATENRCHSMSLGLHYLLGQIAQEEPPCPGSVMIVSFSMGIAAIIHEIWRYDRLRPCLGDGFGPLEEVRAKLNDIAKAEAAGARLFSTRLHYGKGDPLKNHPKRANLGPFLHVLVPGLTWCPPEEVLHRIDSLLKDRQHSDHDHCCMKCLGVERILVDRVSRIPLAYPLISDPKVFVSQFLQICSLHGAEVMLLDDMATQLERTGQIESHWLSMAKNAMRLKRIPFQGAERVVFELLRASGRRILQKRPMELSIVSRPDGKKLLNDQLVLCDSFRGASGVFLGEGAPCAVVVDLPYDMPFTPLQRDFENLKRNLKSLIPSAKVNVVGPAQRAGVNCALSTLATVSNNTCHVVSVDEVWLHSLLRSGSLMEFTADELYRIVRDEDNETAATATLAGIENRHVCAATRVVDKKLGKQNHSVSYAVPFRHNWGVLVVNRPSSARIKFALKAASKDPKPGRLPIPSWVVVDETTPNTEKRGSIFPPDAGGRCPSPDAAVFASTINEMRAGGTHTTEASRGNEVLEKERGMEMLCALLTNANARNAALEERVGSMLAVMNEKSKVDASDFVSVWSLIWGDCPESMAKIVQPQHISWEALIRFKENFCDKVFGSAEWQVARETAWSGDAFTEQQKHWVDALFRLTYFDFSRETNDSVVSFFLELLLAHARFESVFHDLNGGLLEFMEGPEASKAHAVALDMVWRLLDPSQRREVSIGHAVSQNESRKQDGAKDEKFVKKGKVPLFSRQWISTVPDLESDYDLRENFDLKPLPCSEEELSGREDVPPGSHLLGATFKKEWRGKSGQWGLLDGKDRPKHIGPTVSGAWFLGAIRDGNRELATDVIKELVSGYHERERLGLHASPPVSKRFYDQGAGSSTSRLPYADIVGRIAAKPQLKEKTFFPFCRTRIRRYTSSSMILCEMIRLAMSEMERDQEKRKKKFEGLAGAYLAEIVKSQVVRHEHDER